LNITVHGTSGGVTGWVIPAAVLGAVSILVLLRLRPWERWFMKSEITQSFSGIWFKTEMSAGIFFETC
jgi:hypothetical protein